VSALSNLQSGFDNASMAKKLRKRKRPDPAKFGFDVMQRVIAATGGHRRKINTLKAHYRFFRAELL
jgi:hypothetical protein